MRIPVTLALCLMGAGQVSAQQTAATPAAAGECLSVSPTRPVVVELSAGTSFRGTLVCLSDDGAWVLDEGRMSKIPLDGIQRIRTAADPVWDGVVKGAAIPLIFWAVLCHECSAEPMLKAALTYGLIGLTWDALDDHRRTLYQGGGRSLSVGWTVRF
jgi:hypothetical protein